MGGSTANNTPIIMYPLDDAYDNSIFAAIPAPSNTLSSITLPTGSLTAPLSLTSPTSASASATTGTTATSGDRNSGAQPSAPPSPTSGLSLDNKIGLGIGIGFGVPTLLLSIWGIWISIRVAKGRYDKKMSNPRDYEMLAPPAYTGPPRHGEYTGLPDKS